MKILGLDTTHKHLVIGCFENDQVIASHIESAWKKQSEHFFPALIQCMEKIGWQADDLDAVVITVGPGSYTGERIAMTFAKVLCTNKPIDLYTVTTFQMIAGLKECAVIMDARSQRAYYGLCKKGQLIEESIKTIDEIKQLKEQGQVICGDIDLLGEAYVQEDYASHLLAIQSAWQKVENIHTLVPHYLKEKEELVQS